MPYLILLLPTAALAWPALQLSLDVHQLGEGGFGKSEGLEDAAKAGVAVGGRHGKLLQAEVWRFDGPPSFWAPRATEFLPSELLQLGLDHRRAWTAQPDWPFQLQVSVGGKATREL